MTLLGQHGRASRHRSLERTEMTTQMPGKEDCFRKGTENCLAIWEKRKQIYTTHLIQK